MNKIRKIEIRKARRLSICLLFLYLTAPGLHCCTQAFSSRGDLCSVSFSLRWLLLSCSPGSRGLGLQQQRHTGLVALQHVGSSQTGYRTRVPCIARQVLEHWTIREDLLTISVTEFLASLLCFASSAIVLLFLFSYLCCQVIFTSHLVQLGPIVDQNIHILLTFQYSLSEMWSFPGAFGLSLQGQSGVSLSLSSHRLFLQPYWPSSSRVQSLSVGEKVI